MEDIRCLTRHTSTWPLYGSFARLSSWRLIAFRSGIAVIRPDHFSVAAPGQESDLIFSVEEASFYGGAWHVRGVLSGAFLLRVTIPGDVAIHKGKLMALRYDPARFRLVAM
jgi:hypothetical protein